MKKILFLGGAPTQIPPIKYALKEGHYVITCDYLPDNPGHRLSNQYYNISTTDKDAVLEIAQTENIDGIVAYASDPAAPTAAYVAEKMGLPGNPYRAVEILARKDLFRKFLADNHFNVPRSKSFSDSQDAKKWLSEIGVPAFVKPVDSSGSKGVTHIQNHDDLESAFEYALQFSREKKVIVEEKIIKTGYQVDSDIFMLNGEVVSCTWGNQHQDSECHPYAPVAISYPSVLPDYIQQKAKSVINLILNNLGFNSGAFNVEFVVDKNDEVWVIEIGPRNGGNLIPQVLKYATGVDMISATVDVALGKMPKQMMRNDVEGCWSSLIVHSRSTGTLKEISLSERAEKYIVEKEIYAKPGDKVNKFSGSHDTIGMMILKYPNKEDMLSILDNMEKDIQVIVD
ncbi:MULTISPECIES: ATP-grasp domain-containing protein [Salinivibrio]|uniref:ATP-grasp domain-containing protein n=1 Tax=Salinivibrio TaxID=51366 RepID=UPI0006144C4F|nr:MULTISPECIES: ATP-grasp domain-containing protein [Salinivibrio]KKA44106.1 carbamoyl-phosphate-synthetase [Salinivibrio sp. KP-1]OOE62345.1 carbamoyl-phosphate-synthetase [Salinivibrio kushneri]